MAIDEYLVALIKKNGPIFYDFFFFFAIRRQFYSLFILKKKSFLKIKILKILGICNFRQKSGTLTTLQSIKAMSKTNAELGILDPK